MPRSTRRPSNTLVIALIVAALLAAIAMPRVRRFLEVDSCLDRGGSWDYEQQRCIRSDDQGSGRRPSREGQPAADH
jgi:hypothetical protein